MLNPSPRRPHIPALQSAELSLAASVSTFRFESVGADLRAAVAGLDLSQKALLVELRARDEAARAQGARLEVAAGAAAARLAAIEAALDDVRAAAAGWSTEKDEDGTPSLQ